MNEGIKESALQLVNWKETIMENKGVTLNTHILNNGEIDKLLADSFGRNESSA